MIFHLKVSRNCSAIRPDLMRAIIHTSELRSWQERANRNEIIIMGMSFPTGGKVDLDYIETPRLAENLSGCKVEDATSRVAPVVSSCKGQSSADVAMTTAGSNPATPTIHQPVLVHCEDCNTDHPEGQDCPICAPLARAAVKAREIRKAWHLFKKGEGSRP